MLKRRLWRLRAIILPACLAIIQIAQGREAESDEAGALAPNDLVHISSKKGPGYLTKDVRPINLFSNQYLTETILTSTNGRVLPGTSLTGTAGQNWARINDSTGTNFAKLGIGDTIIMSGGEQFLVSGITNKDKMVSLVYELHSNRTNSPFTWFKAPFALEDSVPRRTGMITGGPGFAVSGFSIANDGGNPGGYWMLDGVESASLLNNRPVGKAPAFVAISAGLGLGPRHANQFSIQSGSIFADLVILAYDDIGIRGGITNLFGPSIIMRQVTVAPGFDSYQYMARGTNIMKMNGLDGRAGDDYATIAPRSFERLRFGDTLLVGSEHYAVIGLSNATHTVTVAPNMAFSHISADFQVWRAPMTFEGTNGLPVAAFTPEGSLLLPRVASAGRGPLYLDNPVLRNSGTNVLAVNNGDAQLSGNLTSDSGAPSVAANAGAGTGPKVSVSGNSIGGEITLVTGDSPQGSTNLLTVTFPKPYKHPPIVSLTPIGLAAAQASIQVTPLTTAMGLILTNGASNLPGATTYHWDYMVVGNPN